MAGNRHHRVLFDLVQGEGRKPVDPTRGDGKPVRVEVGVGPAVDPKPNGAASSGPASGTSAVGAGGMAGSPPSRPRIEVISSDAVRDATSPRRTKDLIAFKTNALYIGMAGILLAVAIVWIVAYNAGSKAKSAELKEFLQEPTPRDPLAGGTVDAAKPAPAEPAPAVTPKKNPPPPRQTTPAPIQTPAPSPAPSKSAGRSSGLPPALVDVAPEGTGSILVPGGRVARDPRPSGYNYLIVERLPPADAERAIKFLADSGIQCVGVPVDRAAGAGNNPLLYQVVALAGLTREQYRDNAGRDALEAEIKRLGEIWQKEQKGTSRFAKPQWVRFGGSP